MDFSKLEGINKTKTTIASGPVILKNDKVLLSLETDDDFWKFPGGTVNDNESFRETAKREALEETGLDIKITDESKPILFTFHKNDDEHVKYYILIHYRAEYSSGKIFTKDPEIKEVKFFKLDKLPRNLAPNVKPVIEELLHRNN